MFGRQSNTIQMYVWHIGWEGDNMIKGGRIDWMYDVLRVDPGFGVGGNIGALIVPNIFQRRPSSVQTINVLVQRVGVCHLDPPLYMAEVYDLR